MRVRDVMTTPAITVAPETPFPELVVPKEVYGGQERRLIQVLAGVPPDPKPC